MAPPSLVYCTYAWHTCTCKYNTPGANRRPICLIVMASCSRCSDPLPELQFVLSDLCIIIILSCFHNGSIFGPRWPEKRSQGIEFVNFPGGMPPDPLSKTVLTHALSCAMQCLTLPLHFSLLRACDISYIIAILIQTGHSYNYRDCIEKAQTSVYISYIE